MVIDLEAPAVVAVVVTCDPGPWFEETLATLRDQDYPNLSVLVVDAASTVDPTPRVAALLPNAHVRRLPRRVGFGRAANEVLGMVDGASHYLFCHDDAALDPDAVRLLVEEAFRSNGGILSPKVVDWANPERLLAVGMTTDIVGVSHPLVEPGELDQQQHDGVRDVLFGPSGTTLVRADLFATLGGFDPVVDEWGEDLNLCWRAHLAGARVLTVPAARVRHAEAIRNGRRQGAARPSAALTADCLADANRVRTVLTCSSLPNLVWIVPVLVFFSLGEAATAVVTGHPGVAVRRVRALARAFRRPVALLRARRVAQRQRRVPDRRIRRLQIRGNARLRRWIQQRAEGPRFQLPFATVPGGHAVADDFWDAGVARRLQRSALRRSGWAEATAASASVVPVRPRSSADSAGAAGTGSGPVVAAFGAPDPSSVGTGSWRLPVVAAAVLLVVWLVGSRSLLGPELPAVGSIPVMPAGDASFWRAWLTTWQPGGLGSVGPSSPALALLGLAGLVSFGALGTLQHILVLGPFIVGPLGMYRAVRWWGSQPGRVAGMVAYALVPLPYNALAGGHWDGLLAYAAMPWLLGMTGRLSDSLPYPATRFGRIGARLLGLGLLCALVGAFAPSFLLVVAVTGVGLAVGSLLAAQPPTAVRLLTISVAAAVVGFVLLLPWSAAVFGSRDALFGAPAGPTGRLGVAALLRMHVGPVGGGALGWGIVVAAGLPLVIGRSWRLAWAARLWALVLLCVAWAWLGGRGLVPAPAPELALVPAAAAVAALIGLGVVAFELDLPGYRFGWRQGVSALAAVGLVAGAFPVLGAAGGGRWHLPSSGPASVMAAEQHAPGGDYRILWLGAPGAIPTASVGMGGGQALATSWDGLPDVTDQWPARTPAGSAALASDVRLAEGGLTTKLGHLLAPFGVRYLVVPNHDGPAGSGAAPEPVSPLLTAGLGMQTDLKPLDVDADYTVYANAAWFPARAVLSAAATPVLSATGTAGARALGQTDLTGSRPVLVGGHPDLVAGRVPAGSTVYVAASYNRSWRLDIDGRRLAPRPALGAGMAFTVPAGAGTGATLAARTDGGIRGLQLAVAALGALLAAVVALDWRRRSRRVTDETVRPEWFTPLAMLRRARRRAAPTAPRGMGSDEVWVDA